jgi:hypothetical protein
MMFGHAAISVEMIAVPGTKHTVALLDEMVRVRDMLDDLVGGDDRD